MIAGAINLIVVRIRIADAINLIIVRIGIADEINRVSTGCVVAGLTRNLNYNKFV